MEIMINTVSQINGVNSTYGANANSKNAVKSSSDDPKIASGAASVVELKGSQITASDRVGSKVSPQDAAALAGDIASALSSSGSVVQEHISAFDAARLLAD